MSALGIVSVLAATGATTPSVGATGSEPVLAFAGAEGFGARAIGGRGGDVYIVTSLADDGVGSLRHGLDTASGPRTIVFEAAGDIRLERPLRFTGSHLTLAGQTSPGGITVRGYPVEIVDSSHVVVRHVRFRPGDENAAGVPGRPGRGNADLVGDAADALSILGSEHVIVDHVSASWSMDETLSVTKSADVTVQHSIISESLDDSFHTEGLHGFGSLVRGTGERGYSFIGNLWAHHQRRMPAIGGQQDPPPPGEPGQGLDVDLVNNIMFDWSLFPNHVVADPYQLRVNLQGNLYLSGPSLAFCRCPWINFEATAEELMIHRSGNVVDNDDDRSTGVRPMSDEDFVGPVTFVEHPFEFDRPGIGELPILDAAIRTLLHAGASRHRDYVDFRVVVETFFRLGRVIDSQDEVGGWPAIVAGMPPLDADRDGMADSWESREGLDPTDPGDHSRYDLDAGYTNLEIYLASLTS